MELIVFALPAALLAFGYLVPGLAVRRDEEKSSAVRMGVAPESACCQGC